MLEYILAINGYTEYLQEAMHTSVTDAGKELASLHLSLGAVRYNKCK